MNVSPAEPGVDPCEDCPALDNLLIVVADLGEGAFLAVLCETCWHRRQYRAELEKRKVKR